MAAAKKAVKTPAPKPAKVWSVAEVLTALKKRGDKRMRDQMQPRFGIVAQDAYGVPMAQIKALAKEIGRDHALALKLWAKGNYDARLLCSMIAEPAKVTPALMDQWRGDFDNWAICDTLCFNLFDKTPHGFAKVRAWSKLRGEFDKRAAFALLASLALHDKKAKDEDFLSCLPLCEAAATDPRNFVKKAVSWALRGMGTRRAALHGACVALADDLAESEDATARWIGKDVLKDLSRPLVQKRLAKKA
jgi:3-methyladenine DNA glycosylase AlkD